MEERFREPGKGERQAQQADGHVEEEGQAPPDLGSAELDEQTAQRWTDAHGDPDDAAEGAEGLGPRRAPEVLLDHPDALRVDQAGADPLHEAGSVERQRVRREAGRDRGQREDRDSEDEDPAAPHEVAGPPGGDEDDTEGQRVAGEDPLQARLAGIQTVLDRGQGDVDDAHADEGHEDRDEQDREDPPAL